VSLHYDPLLAKLIVHAPTREGAIDRMARALDELLVAGVETSAPFHRRVMEEADFRAGRLSIRYLEEHPGLLDGEPAPDELRIVALAAALLEEERRRLQRSVRIGEAPASGMSAWRRAGWPWQAR
jgi:acetyl/propionyl-CoA carboxylase alpha subunit